jgi:hypothetical protein
MGRPKTRLPDVRIDPLRHQIEHWRRTRTKRSPMPEPLWRGAVGLAREHGVYATAQTLRLSYDSLRTRAEAAGAGPRRGKGRGRSQTTFVELAVTPPAVGAAPSGPIVEVIGPQGQRLTVRLRGGELDVAELIRQCWSGRE